MSKSFRRYIANLLSKNSTARHVSILASGTFIAQAIPIAISPILTRLYAPEEFGLAALYLACVSILAVIATARYEMAITLLQVDQDAAYLVTFTLKLCAAVSGLLYVPIFFFGETMAARLGNPELAPWLYLLPVSVLAAGAFSVFQFWCNRTSQYRRMSLNRIQNSSLTALFNTGLGLTHFHGGLILGGTIGQLSAAAIVGRNVLIERKEQFQNHKLTEQLAIAKRYASHPKHIAPAQLIGVVAQQIPIFMISNLFALSVAGFFSMAYRLVSLPSGLIASAIGDVYRQKISVAYNHRGEFKQEFITTLQKTSLIASPPFAVLYFVAPDLFEFVFGEAWRVAGEYAQILVVASFFQFIFTPIDKGAVVVGATRYILAWHTARLLSFAALLLIAKISGMSISSVLWGFVAVNVLLYILDGLIEYRFAKGLPHESW